MEIKRTDRVWRCRSVLFMRFYAHERFRSDCGSAVDAVSDALTLLRQLFPPEYERLRRWPQSGQASASASGPGRPGTARRSAGKPSPAARPGSGPHSGALN
ncbi:hypothetical protein, partial [Paenibacillus chitinolyticus]|uniref:hypothetical protein n=1 Tax=Paenibacillus chitinolyticus TaxID=79263 RepID=UPI002284F6D7